MMNLFDPNKEETHCESVARYCRFYRPPGTTTVIGLTAVQSAI